MDRAKQRVWIATSLWLLAIIAAAAFDRAMASEAHAIQSDSFLRSHSHLREAIKATGFYPFTIVLAIVIAVVHRTHWRAAVFLLVATLTAGLNEAIKWIAGRARPFKTITGDSPSLTPFELHPFPPFSAKNLSFPSGHAALAFATAASLGILWPRGRWVFYGLATIVAAERVLENAHWLSDAVAAAALGVGGVTLVRYFLWDRKWGKRVDG
ncbi:MAG TPA: phosphatase PAP2 family protein [Tepidisphaeraceae bacterium]|nr:phosphatase PAP2 family protein [Tepidisphaeraceae bacterium]